MVRTQDQRNTRNAARRPTQTAINTAAQAEQTGANITESPFLSNQYNWDNQEGSNFLHHWHGLPPAKSPAERPKNRDAIAGA